MKNVIVQDITATYQGGVFSVLEAGIISIENSNFEGFNSANGGFIVSKSTNVQLIITSSQFVCIKNYD